MVSNSHALLSASSSHRWLNCPPSARLGENYEDTSSAFAAEGTDAHTLCEYMLKSALSIQCENPVDNLTYYNEEMDECASGYASYVMELLAQAKEKTADPIVLIEQKLDFSKYVPDGFGTGDCVIIADGTLSIVDYKHGKGVEVSAVNNPQMKLYALGALEIFDSIYDIDTVTMTIYQPRIGNVSEYTVSKDELFNWAETTLKPAAELAFNGGGEFACGEWCRFCKAKSECRKRAEENMKLAAYDFRDPPLLSDAEIEEILGRLDAFLSWANDVKDFAYKSALDGKIWNGSFLALRGVNLALLAGVMLVMKMIDAVDDVVFGFLIDKLKITEWRAFRKLTGEGKYLPWYRLTFFLFPLFTIVFYVMPSGLPQWAKLTWFIVSYLLYDFSCTLNEVPMNSLIMTLTDNTDERSHIITVKGLITVIAAVVVGFALNFLVDPVAGPGFSFTSVSVVTMLICIGIMIPLVKNGKEYNTELKNTEDQKNESYTLRDMWNCVRVNKYMAVYLLSSLIAGVTSTSAAVGSLISFYLFDGKTMITSIPVLIAFVPAIAINTQADKIAKRFGRRNSMILLGAVFGGMYILQYFAGYEKIVVFIVLGTIAGLANSLRSIFMNFIAPDTIEYTRYKTGKDCAGIFYALNAFVTKAVGGVGSSIGLFVMGLFGWHEVTAQSYE